ncbi:unnamed protein product [Mytilus coruscus]|uniref:Zinc finger PHD-type domain-containing protein n=1 Tax=Mytilus coruscus TaxID=42192 RepID=A0A6J8F1H5_MYTCO|nr:unnamed protein product [Mytilus coruscus]
MNTSVNKGTSWCPSHIKSSVKAMIQYQIFLDVNNEELLSNWNRAIEWSEDEPTPSRDTSAVNMSTIHNYCSICNQTAQPETSIDCIACSQLFQSTCENIDPVRISQTEEKQYSCRSCSIMDMDVVNISLRSNDSIIDTEETIPKSNYRRTRKQQRNIAK